MNMINRLKHGAVKEYRAELLKTQGNICPLCLGHIDKDEAVLDHDHKTGKVRSVLHRGCNAMLGKLENGRAINKLTDDERFYSFLRNVFCYVENVACHFDSENDVYHPTFKTEEEKKEIRKKKRKKARLKKAQQTQKGK